MIATSKPLPRLAMACPSAKGGIFLLAIADGDRVFECDHRDQVAIAVDNFEPAGQVQNLACPYVLRRHLAGCLDGFAFCGLEIGELFALLVLCQPAALVDMYEVDGHGLRPRLILSRRGSTAGGLFAAQV